MCYTPIIKIIRKNKVEVVKSLPKYFIEVQRKDVVETKAFVDMFNNFGTYNVRAKRIYVNDLKKPDEYALELPCGKCADCLNRIVNQWSFRISKDIEQNDVRAFFVTLTYRPECRTTKINLVDKRTGEMLLKKRNDLYFERNHVQRHEIIDFNFHDPLFDDSVSFDDVYNRTDWHIRKDYYKSFYYKVPKSFQGVVEGFEKFEADSDFYYYYGPKTHVIYDQKDIYTSELADFSCENGFLNYDDVQKFIKRVRRMLDYYYDIKYLKYFCCGEYSPAPHIVKGRLTEGFLPHYHLLIWFKETPKSDYGYFKPKISRTDKRYKESSYGISKFHDNGSLQVFPLTTSLFHDFIFHAWGLSERQSFQCSNVRSVQGASRYISKYILKAVKACNYKNEYQKLSPFKRWMSSGIGKLYAQLVAPSVCSNADFGYQDGEYYRFYPSIMLKWMYSHDVEIQKDDFLKWYDNDKYFVMMRKREDFIKKLGDVDQCDVDNKNIKIANMVASMCACDRL